MIETANGAALTGEPAVIGQHPSLESVRIVEEAAIAAARTMGQGDRSGSDQAAVQAMRRAFEDVQIAGNIVIGEGERDEAPMLYIGEKVGAAPPDGHRISAGGYRRRSAGRHQSVRAGHRQFDRGAGGVGTRRTAARAGLLHGKDHRRSGLPRCAGYRRAGEIQPEGHRAFAWTVR